MEKTEQPFLRVENLGIEYATDRGIVKAVNGVSFSLNRGETLGLVGETGAGKTTTALGIMRLISNPPGKLTSGRIFLGDEELLSLSEKSMQHLRGKRISMVFQDPMTALNPVLTVGEQICEVIRLHEKISRQEASRKTAEMLKLVGIPADRCEEYPHQFSGGMRQRVMIAIALACSPELLIADEPTTALDVTIQAQVLELINRLKKQLQTSMLLITHDLGVVAEVCDRVAVMYAGEIIEIGTLSEIFSKPSHPYTIGLFGSIPSVDKKVIRLNPIPGLMPDPTKLGAGCHFCPRCPHRTETCERLKPSLTLLQGTHQVNCHLYSNN